MRYKMKQYYWMKNQSRQENLVYIGLWGIMFATPILSMYIRMIDNTSVSFDWAEVMMVWQRFAIFLLLFLIHNFLLAPLLVHQHKRVAYFTALAAILAVFAAYQCSSRPKPFHEGPHGPSEEFQRQGRERNFEGHRPGDGFEDHGPDERFKPQHDEGFKGHGPGQDFGAPGPRHDDKFQETPPPFIGEHDIIAFAMLVLMFGANLGIKGYFKSRNDQKKLTALQKENLEQQLEYLKYQINPHFFMNTLNNIHALVDIDPEKAKDTILELSKMMRFVLYEGDKNGVPLRREFEFIRHYVTLMKLRYTDKVTISLDLPLEPPDKMLPPLMLITFIENAFKHGISYQHASFIDVKVGIEGTRLRFECRNSKADKPNQEKGGVGLQNVKQRLHLLYDNNFTLNIQDNPDTYIVELIIPLT